MHAPTTPRFTGYYHHTMFCRSMTIPVAIAIYNAAMTVISPSNVRNGVPPLSARLWIAGFGDKASSTPRQKISLQRNYSDQHHILTVPDNPLSPNLFQTRVSIFSPKSTSAARIGSSVTLADCPPRQRSPRQKRLLWVCCYCYSERGYAGNLTIKRQQHNANLPISL